MAEPGRAGNTDLLELEDRLVEAGATVHWARDGAEASAIVVDLTRAGGADEAVKVKSMATVEMGLNEALEAAGIRAWETNLDELIVQLGDDLPSHILVPAIRRNRAEVRENFRREMAGAGRAAPADLADDPARLAQAARLHLREKFLRAKVAASGGNFAVAETGTLDVVESEGNGRVCLTLPDTLLRVPQRVPRLRAGRRARPRLGLPRADRRGAGADAVRHPWRGRQDAAVRIEIPALLVHLRTRVVDESRGGFPSAATLAMKMTALTLATPAGRMPLRSMRSSGS